jgi:hypothetical protein
MRSAFLWFAQRRGGAERSRRAAGAYLPKADLYSLLRLRRWRTLSASSRLCANLINAEDIGTYQGEGGHF